MQALNMDYDVVVLGGGTAGVVAAVQAGRGGARTLLVEKNGMLGGTLTVGGVNAPSHFFAWDRQIIAGIGWELVCRTLAEAGILVTDTSPPTRGVAPDRAIYAALCDAAVLDAGVTLLLHVMPAAVRFHDDRWRVTLCTKTGLRDISARVLIDATGDANGVALAGFALDRPDVVQPATLVMRCSGYDPGALDYDALKIASDQAIEAGALCTTDIAWNNNGPATLLRAFGYNANHVRSTGADTSEGRTHVEIEARRAVMRLYRFFRRQPGLENFRIDWVCVEAGIRETAVIRGKTRMVVSDYEAGRVYADALCYAFYPIDEHLNDGHGINFRRLRQGVIPTIPRGAMLPAGSRFLIVAGRCIASDRETQSAIRVEAPCMAMGQAAGAMAVLAARQGVDPAELPLAAIHALLREHGAIVPQG